MHDILYLLKKKIKNIKIKFYKFLTSWTTSFIHINRSEWLSSKPPISFVILETSCEITEIMLQISKYYSVSMALNCLRLLQETFMLDFLWPVSYLNLEIFDRYSYKSYIEFTCSENWQSQTNKETYQDLSSAEILNLVKYNNSKEEYQIVIITFIFYLLNSKDIAYCSRCIYKDTHLSSYFFSSFHCCY